MNRMGLGALLQFDPGESIRKIGQMGLAVETGRRQLEQLGRGADRVRTGMSQAFGGIRSIAMPAMIATTVVTGGAVAATVQFDEAISKIGTALGKTQFGAVRGELELLAKTMGQTLPVTATEAASAMELLVKAGVEVRDLATSLPAVLGASIAEGMPTDQAASIIVAAVNQFGLGMRDSTRVANALSRAADASTASIASMGEGLTYVGPIAAKMGLSIEDTAAALAVLDTAGQKGTVGGTHLAAALEAMTSPRHAQWFEALGIKIVDATGKMRPFMDVIAETVDKLHENKNEQERLIAAYRLFGQQGGLAIAAMAKDGRKSFDAMLGKVEGTTTTVQEKADIIAGSFIGMGKQIRSALEGIGIELVTAFGPDLRAGLVNTLAFVRGVTSAFTALRSGDTSGLGAMDPSAVAVARGLQAAVVGIRDAFVQAGPAITQFMAQLTPERVTAMVKFAGIFAVLAPVLLTVMPVLASMVTILGGLGTAMGGLTTIGGSLWGMLTTLYGVLKFIPALGWMLTGAITVLVAAFSDMSNVGSSWLIPMLGGLWNILKETGIMLWDLVKAIGSAVAPVFQIFGDIVVMLGSVIGAVVSGPLMIFFKFLNAIGTVIAGIITKIGAMIQKFADMIRTFKEGAGQIAIFRKVLGIGQLGAGSLNDMRQKMGLIVEAEASSARMLANVSGIAEGASAEMRVALAIQNSQVDRELEKIRSFSIETARAAKEALVGDLGDRIQEAFSESLSFGSEFGQAIKEAILGIELETIPITVNMDGRKVGSGIARSQLELKDRAGANTPASQRRLVLERGVIGR